MQVILSEGKTVTLKERYPFKDNRDLIVLYRNMNAEQLESMFPVAAKMVEAWDYESDPSDVASYEELDALDLWRLFRHINDFWVERVVTFPKPLANGSTAPLPLASAN